jgi:hypothetical protein
MKVSNMVSKSQNKIPNQFIITDNAGVEYFQSYQTIIAKRFMGDVTIDCNNPYSVTTSKYLYQFLNVTSQEFKANMKADKYDIQDLNIS